ncbi:MAG TPA: alcohol dehydrogenase catalytic domain-containing protein [Candidatus Dormibacteraeota bacterium]|nr:alcohol dehydrogenase catalytic domain-containing protein [Candidatus Dormibacteraeota bacterium]
MRQLTFLGPGRLEWQEAPAPVLEGPGQALVRPIVATTCDLDRWLISGGAPAPPGPFPLGHEFVAEVLDVGDEVRSVVPGARVAVPYSISCGECDRCRRGITASCTTIPVGAMYGVPVRGQWGGAMSDVVRVPFADAMLVPLPDAIASTAVASLSDNLPDGWRTVAPHLAARPGAEVLIAGGGAVSISLFAVDVAVGLGASRVVFIDEDPERCTLAARLGAEVRQGPPPARAGRFPITVDASGRHAGLHCALRSTEPGGVCTSTGIYFEATTPMPLLEMFTDGVTFITARASSRPIIPAILDAVADGRIHPERITSGIVRWDDAIDALLEVPTKLVMERD